MTLKTPFLLVARLVLRLGADGPFRHLNWATASRSPALPPVIVLLSSLSLSACVIPIGPQFQDPPAAQNFAPTITDSNPVNGAIVQTKTFRVTFFDPNLSDDLHVRWIADYPSYGPNSRLLMAPDFLASPTATTAQKLDTSITIDCIASNLALMLTQHQIMVIIADRPFLMGDNLPLDRKLTALPDDAGRVEAHWTLNLECK
jgi:hypothetical protein